MKYFFIFTLFFCISAFAAVQVPADWQVLKTLGDVTVFHHKVNKDQVLTVLAGEAPEKRDLTKENFDEVIEKMAKSRKMTNSIIGLDNWAISKSDLVVDKNKKIIKIQGSYVKDNVKYNFWEWQIHQDLNYMQIQLEAPVSQNLTAEQAQKIIDKVQFK